MNPSFRTLLEPLGDETLAVSMAAYMRNQFAFLGVPKPRRAAATVALRREARHWPPEQLRANALALWGEPEREFHYLAVDLLVAGVNQLEVHDLEWVREFVVQKSWWDTVDTLAAHVVGPLVRAHPPSAAAMELWGRDGNIWVRRTALLHQLAYGAATDQERLFALCLENSGRPEFFIRKAIGWALRQYARVEPAEVAAFLEANRGRLSPLSYREAAKHLGHR